MATYKATVGVCSATARWLRTVSTPTAARAPASREASSVIDSGGAAMAPGIVAANRFARSRSAKLPAGSTAAMPRRAACS